MKIIKLNKLLDIYLKWLLAGFCVLLLIILYWSMSSRKDLIFDYNDHKMYWDTMSEELLVRPGEAFKKYTDWYNKVLGWYGPKYHRKHKRGMHPRIRSKWVKNLHEYNTLLDLPPMALLSIALFESSYDLKATGPFKEMGMFQMRKGAVMQAEWYHKTIRSKNIKDKLRFRYQKESDLQDPLNQLKIAAVLLWGYRIDFGNDPMWYISAYHWGGMMGKYYYAGVLPPKEFVFNKGTVKEDVRDPFSYYFVWAQIDFAFRHFRKDINIPYDYIREYRKHMNKYEKEYIYDYKYIRKLKRELMDIKEYQAEFKKEQKKKLKRLDALVKKADKEYSHIHGLIKTGQFKNIKDIFSMGIGVYKKLIKDIAKDNVRIRDKTAIYMAGASLIILFVLAVVGLFYIVRGLWRRWRKRKNK